MTDISCLGVCLYSDGRTRPCTNQGIVWVMQAIHRMATVSREHNQEIEDKFGCTATGQVDGRARQRRIRRGPNICSLWLALSHVPLHIKVWALIMKTRAAFTTQASSPEVTKSDPIQNSYISQKRIIVQLRFGIHGVPDGVVCPYLASCDCQGEPRTFIQLFRNTGQTGTMIHILKHDVKMTAHINGFYESMLA